MFQGSFIDPLDCDERNEGDTGRIVLSGITISCMSDVNIVLEQAGTMLNDGINNLIVTLYRSELLECKSNISAQKKYF